MKTLPQVRYLAASSADHFTRILDRVLTPPHPVRHVQFGLATPAGNPNEALLHNVPRFILALAGNHAQLVADGSQRREISLCPGEAVFFPALGWNVPLWKGRLEFFSAVFHSDHTRFVHGSWTGLSRPRVTYYHARLPGGPVSHLVLALSAVALRLRDTRAARSMLEALLFELRQMLVTHRPDVPGKGLRTWQAISDYIQEHLHQSISLRAIADRFDLHPNHVSRLSRHVGREGFVRYLTRLRMERAERLLAEGQMDIESIALGCGFSDANYFRKVFRRCFGSAPSQRIRHGLPKTTARDGSAQSR